MVATVKGSASTMPCIPPKRIILKMPITIKKTDNSCHAATSSQIPDKNIVLFYKYNNSIRLLYDFECPQNITLTYLFVFPFT